MQQHSLAQIHARINALYADWQQWHTQYQARLDALCGYGNAKRGH